MTTTANNKRIARNTLLLYFRMILVMAVALYTSRVVLNTLGVEDYGIYNVVGGIVAMFGFINSSMSSATQRYLTFTLGKGDEKRLQTIFSTSLQIHALIAGMVFILGETVGLWFLWNKMQIPVDRMDAAFWVLQCSILSAVVMIVSVPYNADIIAHERMSVFAYISTVEVILKLLIVYLLVVFSADKLILYGILTLMVQVVIRFCYSIYCNRHFEESNYQHVLDKSLFKEMTGFAGWSMFGNLSAVLFTQGVNMLLNVYFGPIINAARAVAVQIQGVMLQFVGNFQTALNPQITKTYASGDMRQMHALMFRSARFSFYLVLLLALPVLYETDFILNAWLKIVPDNTVVFTRIIICMTLMCPISNPMVVANRATGKVRMFEMISGGVLFLVFPVSWTLLEYGFPAYSVFIVNFVLEGFALLARMLVLRYLIGVGIRDWFFNVYLKIGIVVASSLVLPSMVYCFLQEGLFRFLAVGTACVISVGCSVYLLGLSDSERTFIKEKAVARFRGMVNRI